MAVRLKSVCHKSKGEKTTYQYDNAGRPTEEIDSKEGRLSKAIDPLHQVTEYQYNAIGEVMKEIRPIEHCMITHTMNLAVLEV
ncbi:hypothetical protein ACF5W4_16585 [Bacillota bacterium Lsc_1132]